MSQKPFSSRWLPLFLICLMSACTDHGGGGSGVVAIENLNGSEDFGQKVSALPNDDQIKILKDAAGAAFLSFNTISEFEKNTYRSSSGASNEGELKAKNLPRLMRDSGCKLNEDKMAKRLEIIGVQCPINFLISFDEDSKDLNLKTIKVLMSYDIKDRAIDSYLDVNHIDFKGEMRETFIDLAANESASYEGSIKARQNEKSTEVINGKFLGKFHSQIYGDIKFGFIIDGRLQNLKYKKTGKVSNGWFFLHRDFKIEVRQEVISDGSSDEIKNYFVNGNQVTQQKFNALNKIFTGASGGIKF